MELPSELCIAETLSDLNMFYIRQIGASLKKHQGLQEQLDREIKIREAAARLFSACTHELQLLQVAKTLHTSNTRTLSYMTRMQRLKANEVIEEIIDDSGFSSQSAICEGRIAISDIRIPLLWKDLNSSNKSKEQHRHVVFCLVTVGSDVQDTSLVSVDRSVTDISFPDAIIFEKASFDFQMNIDLFTYSMSGKSVANTNSQKLLSRFSKSGSKTEEKKLKEYLEENANKGFKSPPLFHNIGSLSLTLADVCDDVKSHDLLITNQKRSSLPIFESMSCRLVAQPSSATDPVKSGYINKLETTGRSSSWVRLWWEVKAGLMKGWVEESKTTLRSTIDLFSPEVKISEIETLRQLRSNSFQISMNDRRQIFAAKDHDTMIEWIRKLRKHKADVEAWGSACMNGLNDRTPLEIRDPSSHPSSELVFDTGMRNTLLYNRLGSKKESPSANTRKQNDNMRSPVIPPAIDCPYLEVSSYRSRRGSLASNDSSKDSERIISSSGDCKRNSCSSRVSETEVDGRRRNSFEFASGRKKKRAPNFPQLSRSTIKEFDKPPLPKVPPPKQKLRLREKGSSSSGSSLDGILEEKLNINSNDVNKPKLRLKHSYENVFLGNRREAVRNLVGSSSYESLRTKSSSQSSGYKSELESGDRSVKDHVWVKRKNSVIPTVDEHGASKDEELPINGFERTQSLDTESFFLMSCNSNESVSCNSLVSASGEAIYDEPPLECRPRTNTMPQASPKVLLRMKSHRTQTSHARVLKPIPTPRKPRTLALNSSASLDELEHIYDSPLHSQMDYEASTRNKEAKFTIQKQQEFYEQEKHRMKLPAKRDGIATGGARLMPIYAQVHKIQNNKKHFVD